FSNWLPRRPIQVNLIQTSGRGEIVIIEQPSQFNDYTASVRIRDRRSGSGDYYFVLGWEKQRYRDYDDDREDGNRRLGLRWSGGVDGGDLIFIRGNQLWVDHREGQPITGADYRFYQSLGVDRSSIVIRKLHGRGNVRIIEQPTRRNDNTAVIMIED